MNSSSKCETGNLLTVARRSRPRRRASLGPLHELLTKKLPDLLTAGNVCDLDQLAEQLGMSFPGVRKWMRPGTGGAVPFRHVREIVALSEKQTLYKLAPEQKANWRPATVSDFHPYIS